MAHISHMCQLVHVHIRNNHATYILHINPKKSAMWQKQRHTSWYSSHISVHKSPKTNPQQYSTNYCQIWAWNKYGPQLTHICHTCNLIHVKIWSNYVNICVNLIWTYCYQQWPGALLYIHFTLSAYVPEQICLPYHICMSHCTNIVVFM